jgi:hypothetical protein
MFLCSLLHLVLSCAPCFVQLTECVVSNATDIYAFGIVLGDIAEGELATDPKAPPNVQKLWCEYPFSTNMNVIWQMSFCQALCHN